MKHVSLNSVSFDCYCAIVEYEDNERFMSKKADFADALGFVTSKMVKGNDEEKEKWQLVAALLSEYQSTVNLFHDEAKIE